jgi:aldehyde oxidoreductase
MSKVADNAPVETIEGVGTPKHPHPLQVAWMAHGGAQCGFCSPGFIVSSKALLDQNPNPDREDVRDWFQKHRNACRCTGYKQLVDAVMDAAKVVRGEMPEVKDIAYKLPDDGQIWGGKYPRPSALAKVTGTWTTARTWVSSCPRHPAPGPGAGQCVPRQHQVHRRQRSGKMPGVVKVVTHKDIKGKNRITGLITFPTNLGDGWDRPILCDEKVFQYGDAIAIVCAHTEAQAKAAADKVKVELEKLPAYMSAPGGHGRRRHGDSPRHAQHLLHQEDRQGR